MILKYKDTKGFWEFRNVLEFSYQNMNKEDSEKGFNAVQESYISEKLLQTRRTTKELSSGYYAIMIYEENDTITFHLTDEEAYLINDKGETIEKIN